MALNRSLPALLSPYLFPPEFSLCLITSVLGASSNWLVERWVVAGLASQSDRLRSGSEAGGQEERGAVVLVSFMREWEAWRDGVRRASVGSTFAAFSYFFSRQTSRAWLVCSMSCLLTIFDFVSLLHLDEEHSGRQFASAHGCFRASTLQILLSSSDLHS